MSDKEWNKKEQRIRRDERKKVKKKRRAKGTLYSLGAFIIALLLSIGSGFLGLNPVGIFSDGSGSHSVIKDNEQEQTEPIKMVDEEVGMQQVVIIVSDKDYIYLDELYDLEGITEIVNGLNPDEVIELVDKRAKSLTFDEIEKLLNDSGIEYNIVKQVE